MKEFIKEDSKMEETNVFETENEDMMLIETEATEVETGEEDKSLGSLALLGGLTAAAVAAIVVAVKKHKAKKAGKPKVKKRLKWVEVCDEDVMIDVEAEETEVDEDIEETA
jgi:hypothetical protein